MASWPGTLPNPLASGYSLAPMDQTIRTDMEVGSARVRRRSAQRVDTVSLSWRLTDAQLATYRAWFEDSSTGISGGASWFTISLPVGDTGYDSKTVRFIGTPSVDALPGLNWQLSGQVEVR